MDRANCTVLITARNAESTIARAVASAVASPVAEILLVDDFSDDDTVARARRAGGDRLRVVRPPRHESLGLARQTALEETRTAYAMVLDADDALLPGRVERLVAAMAEETADLCADGLELFSGATDTLIRPVPLPEFLRTPAAAVRIFERNYLPGIGQIAFRTAPARRVGYNPVLRAAEDVDFFLRNVTAGARVAFVPETGYRMYSYPGSVSRNLPRQRQMLAELLRKHDYSTVAKLYRSAGYDARVTSWGLCSMATFRNEFEFALAQLFAACPADTDLGAVLEPAGPYPVPEGWRLGFTRGTLRCLLGRPAEALVDFELAAAFNLTKAEITGEIRGAPDLLNNWGVALALTGQPSAARTKFAAALELFPSYLDARLNLEAPSPSHLTSHPLRRQPSRSEY